MNVEIWVTNIDINFVLIECLSFLCRGKSVLDRHCHARVWLNQEDIYAPDDIFSKHKGGCLIQKSADNIVTNTKTIDCEERFIPLQEQTYRLLAAFKTHWWPSVVVCSMVGLWSLWHIPYFHSQFYYQSTIDFRIRQIKVKRGQDNSFNWLAVHHRWWLFHCTKGIRGPVRVRNSFKNSTGKTKMDKPQHFSWDKCHQITYKINFVPAKVNLCAQTNSVLCRTCSCQK